MAEPNPFKLRAQATKAAAIAERVRELGLSPHVLQLGIDNDWWWQEAAEAAGVNADKAPSVTTRAMVLGILDAPWCSGFSTLKLPEVAK